MKELNTLSSKDLTRLATAAGKAAIAAATKKRWAKWRKEKRNANKWAQHG